MLPPTMAELPQAAAAWWSNSKRRQRHRAEEKMQRLDGFTEGRHPEDAKTKGRCHLVHTQTHRHTDTQI